MCSQISCGNSVPSARSHPEVTMAMVLDVAEDPAVVAQAVRRVTGGHLRISPAVGHLAGQRKSALN